NEKRFFTSAAQIARHFHPKDGNPFGHRDDPSGLATIKSVTRDCAVMMVDDVHKMHVFRTVDRMLAEPDSYEKYYFIYHPHHTTTNALCICLNRKAPVVGRMQAIIDWFGMQLERDYRPVDEYGGNDPQSI